MNQTADPEPTDIQWRPAVKAQWNRLLRKAGWSALEQCWSYGEAIATQHHHAVERFVLMQGKREAALLQIVEGRLLPGVRLSRIVRGPVWLDGHPDPGLRDAVPRSLRDRYGILRRRPLLLLPELADTPDNFAALRATGLRRMVSGYGSSRLDLTPEPAQLRAALDGNWRNALNRAERGKLKLDRAVPGSALAELLAAYDGMRRGRRFVGPSGRFVAGLAAQLQPSGDLFVVRALAAGEMVAGALFVRHGGTATYLVGWTGEAGRNVGAGQFVLWHGALA
ncbi:MAG: GNAT family N-acetyltransferase, partial [Alphaproteobacteria bacterium]